jgi:hypothetical protein
MIFSCALLNFSTRMSINATYAAPKEASNALANP